MALLILLEIVMRKLLMLLEQQRNPLKGKILRPLERMSVLGLGLGFV